MGRGVGIRVERNGGKGGPPAEEDSHVETQRQNGAGCFQNTGASGAHGGHGGER